MEHKKLRWKIVILAAILILVLVLLYSGLRILESTVLHRESGATEETVSKTIVRDGVSYYPRLNITTILLTGVDTVGPMTDSGSYNNPAEADMVSLLIIDQVSKDVDIISLNRDSMVDMTVLGVGGKPSGTQHAQLALAHTYGNGLEMSSRNLVQTVSNLLYGVQIDHYITINMDAITVMNDAVGGVTVEVTEDFSQVDASIPMGRVTLMGKQAVNYVRLRYGVDDQLNLSRMDRQKKYMQGFMTALHRSIEEDPSFLLTAYSDAASYMVTDCTTSTLSSLLDRYGDYALGEIITIDGENVMGESYMEYHLDEADLDRVILEYLYAPKK